MGTQGGSWKSPYPLHKETDEDAPLEILISIIPISSELLKILNSIISISVVPWESAIEDIEFNYSNISFAWKVILKILNSIISIMKIYWIQ